MPATAPTDSRLAIASPHRWTSSPRPAAARGLAGPARRLRRQAKQRLAQHEPGLVAGHVRELVGTDHVADGIDAPVARAQAGIDDDALRPLRDTRRPEAEAG